MMKPPSLCAGMRLVTGLVMLIVAADGFWMLKAGISFDPQLLLFPLFMLQALLVFLMYRWLKPGAGPLFGPCLYLMNLLAFSALGVTVLSYLIARLDQPLVTRQVERVDRLLGLNWHAYVGYVGRHPFLARLFAHSYHLITLEAAFLSLFYIFRRDVGGLHRYVLGFTLTALICIVISGFWPSTDAYDFYKIDAAHYPISSVAAMKLYLHDFMSMREHSMKRIPANMNGIITFPSFHAAFAVLIIVLARDIKPIWLRIVMSLFNFVMLLSIPVIGGHYFIDAFAGAAIALMVMAFVGRMVRPAPLP